MESNDAGGALFRVDELWDTYLALVEDSVEAERLFRQESERHSGMNPNTIGA